MLKIYGGDLSSPANKVRFVANYIGLNYEYIPVKIREGEHRKPEFLKMNPAGKIPVIDDDGFYVFESGAISRYLAVKHNSDLYPDNLQQRATIDQWSDFAAHHVGTAMGKVIFNKVFFQFAKIEKDERSLADGINFLNRFLPVVDNLLAQTPFVAGPTITLADMAMLAAVDPAEVSGIDLNPYRHLMEWRAALKKESFYQKCFNEYGEPLKSIVK